MAAIMESLECENTFVEHSFQEHILDKTVFFKTLQMRDSLFLWIGDTKNFDFLAVASPTKMVRMA